MAFTGFRKKRGERSKSFPIQYGATLITSCRMLNLNQMDKRRWAAIANPGFEVNDLIFQKALKASGFRKKVLNCASTESRSQRLLQFQMPFSWSFDKCLKASAGKVETGLEGWEYEPLLHPQPNLSYFKELPDAYKMLSRSPWAQYPSGGRGTPVNARYLRYHYDLWHALKPKTLRGVVTTLVFVTPQIGYSLTPHINIDHSFGYFMELCRKSGPCQFMPARFLYPDARTKGFEDAPAAIFADILPHVGGDDQPTMEGTPNAWGEFAWYDRRNYYYGYPFCAMQNQLEDQAFTNLIKGGCVLPNGHTTQAKSSTSYVYATCDPELNADLLMTQKRFQTAHGLNRGVITHDGLPFQLPPEMEACVYAVIVTAWELEMKNAGDLTEYTLDTQHSAIRSYHFYQQVEPYYSNFLRMFHELEKLSGFETYLLSNHLNNSWLGGNLCISNQMSFAEQEVGPDLLRNYYRQQLDWQMGIHNLWNQVAFRRRTGLEDLIPADGLLFHQMQPLLKNGSHLFQRPFHRLSPWPKLHPGWIGHDQDNKAIGLEPPAFEL